MGAVKKRVQSADKNKNKITIIHNMTTVHQLISCEVKSKSKKKYAQIKYHIALLWIMDWYFAQKGQFN